MPEDRGRPGRAHPEGLREVATLSARAGPLWAGRADDQVRQAIRFGAATMAAQQAADAWFFEFRDRYLKQLDSPLLMWAKP